MDYDELMKNLEEIRGLEVKMAEHAKSVYLAIFAEILEHAENIYKHADSPETVQDEANSIINRIKGVINDI